MMLKIFIHLRQSTFFRPVPCGRALRADHLRSGVGLHTAKKYCHKTALSQLLLSLLGADQQHDEPPARSKICSDVLVVAVRARNKCDTCSSTLPVKIPQAWFACMYTPARMLEESWWTRVALSFYVPPTFQRCGPEERGLKGLETSEGLL